MLKITKFHNYMYNFYKWLHTYFVHLNHHNESRSHYLIKSTVKTFAFQDKAQILKSFVLCIIALDK